MDERTNLPTREDPSDEQVRGTPPTPPVEAEPANPLDTPYEPASEQTSYEEPHEPTLTEQIAADDGYTAPAEEPTDEQVHEAPEAAPFWVEPQPAPARTEPPRIMLMALAWLIAAVLGAGIGAGAMLYLAERGDVGGGRVNVVQPPITNTNESDPGSAAAVAKAVLPSIVRLDVAQTFQGGVGSGVIYDSAGHIITNDHVVEGASRIDVSLPNGETVEGRVIGSAAPFVDIAVVKVDADNLTPATFGSTKDVEVGELAIALGSPYGLDATVTAGVISALHRNPNLDPNRPLTDAIQTDAPINPGNSGGALANSRGEVIGINTAIVGGEGNVGVGFAIPIEIARKVAEQIIQTGRAELAYLGIQGATLPDGGGARVIEVNPPNGPAGRAGVRPDDVIVEFAGQPVDSMNTLIALLTQHNVGDTVQIVVERDGRRETLRATLQSRPAG